MKKVYTCSSAYENYEFKEARKYMADHGIELIMSTSEHPIVGKDFEALLPELDAYIVGLEKVPESVMQQGKKLKILARYGVGTDNVDFIRAKDYGIICTNVRCQELSRGVAELALCLALSGLWNVCEQNKLLKYDHVWGAPGARQLTGKTVGLVGYGNISQHTAKLVKGFDVRILAYDVKPNYEKAAEQGVALVSFDELVAQSDVISIHCPSLPSTYHLFNKDVFKKMKNDAVLVNTARGALVDEQDLYEALANGEIGCAAIDVFDKEPTDMSSPLLGLKNFIGTPHIAGCPIETAEAMAMTVARQLVDVFEGREPEFWLNP